MILKAIVFFLALLFTSLYVNNSIATLVNKKGRANSIIPVVLWTIFYILNQL